MIFVDYKPFTVKQMKLYARKRKIQHKLYNKLRKNDLADFLKQDQSARTIQNAYKGYTHFRLKSQWVNHTDPITQDSLQEPWFEIELVPHSGKIYRYNMTSFYEYLKMTGNFKDPYTDTPFSDNQIKCLDNQLRKKGLYKESLYSMKYNKRRQRAIKRQYEQEEQLLAIERQIGDLLTEMCDYLDASQYDSYDNSEPYYILVHDFFPNFCHLFFALSNLSVDYAQQSLKHYVAWVEKQNVPLGNVILLFFRKEYSDFYES